MEIAAVDLRNKFVFSSAPVRLAPASAGAPASRPRRGATAAAARSAAAYSAQALGAQYACVSPRPKGNSRASTCRFLRGGLV